MVRSIATALLLVSLVGCRDTLGPEPDSAGLLSNRGACVEPRSDETWLTFRAVNESEFEADSLQVTLGLPAGPYNRYDRYLVPFGSPSEPGCYTRLPRSQPVGSRRQLLAYSYMGFRPQGGWYVYHSTYVGLDPDGLSGDSVRTPGQHGLPPGDRYTLRYRLTPYTRFDVTRETVIVTAERFGGPGVNVRFFNVSPAELTDIRVELPDTLIAIPRLAPGDSTGYFPVRRSYRMVIMSFWAGSDSLHWSPDDFLGEPWLPEGWYRLSLDTLHTRWFRNESVLVTDGRTRN